jgi:SAM-dependent methyltransferase
MALVMEKQLDAIKKAYDLTVEQYRMGINPLDDVPDDIKNSPFYKSLSVDKLALSSGAPDIEEYLAPERGMRFLDAGCSANIVNYRLDRWPSTYYGVDISPMLIEAMKNFVKCEQVSIGGLYTAQVTGLPFDNDFFDICAVIGVLEYGTLEHIGEALMELNRVMKPESRVVIDIPNKDHPYITDMVKLEKHLGRTIFPHSRAAFEKILKPLFISERIDDSRVMIKYFVRKIK